MKPPALNLYGDSKRFLSTGFGADIQSQRLDPLDLAALEALDRLAVGLSQPPLCMDLGCGRGALGALMAMRGADCLAIDHLPLSKRMHPEVTGSGRIRHVEADLLQLDDTLSSLCLKETAYIVVCQRVLHYFPWSEAVEFLRQVHRWMQPQGRLFLGVSGLSSELGRNYLGKEREVKERFFPLHEIMQKTHGILGSVCLYQEAELEETLKIAGFRCQSIHTSPFGNLKAIALPS